MKFTSERLDAVAIVFVLIVARRRVAILVAGVRALEPEPAVAADPGALVLALVGAALASVALFVNYDGFSSLWSEVGERDSAEFFFEPAVAVAAMLAGIVLLQARPRFAAGLLVAVGFATALHFLGRARRGLARRSASRGRSARPGVHRPARRPDRAVGRARTPAG